MSTMSVTFTSLTKLKFGMNLHRDTRTGDDAMATIWNDEGYEVSK
jgi:hypothetical protein